MLVGLTGGIASGKSSLADAFSKLGIEVISADAVASELMRPNSSLLVDLQTHFDESLINPDGSLDRNKLRQIIFDQPKKRKLLDSITHPAIGARIFQLAELAESAYVILEIPLLIESGMHNQVDRVLVIHADEDTQIDRIIKRDHCSREQALQIIHSQAKSSERLKFADDIVNNNAGLQQLRNKARFLHHKYLQMANNADSFGKFSASGLELI
ncbi:MAG: dephospho-CoA kinase [Gammaproteobacteria bacterium]|nr:dephospho-CoA kinase [Gammaproteobacteria bacterium]NNM12834.1 dephospho-CoA kinase [Gammaproteobacteria bacterium]